MADPAAPAGSTEDDLGPVDSVVVEFPSGRVSAAGFGTLLDLVDRNIVRVLDLEFVRKGPDGRVEPVTPEEALASADADASALIGSASGLLDSEDLTRAAELIEPGSLAGILVYENVWAAAMTAAMRRNGARVVAEWRVDPADLDAALADSPA